MAQVVAHAIRDREHPLAEDLVVVVDRRTLHLRRSESARIVERTRSRRGTHNERRPYIVRAVVEHLRAQYRRAMGAAAPDDPDWDRELDARLRRTPEVYAALERMWPVLTGGELVHDLFSFTALVRSAADGILIGSRPGAAAPSPLEQRPRRRMDRGRPRAGRRGRRAARSARGRRGPGAGEPGGVVATRPVRGSWPSSASAGSSRVRRSRRATPARATARLPTSSTSPARSVTCSSTRRRTSRAMQWRMLARRCPSGSMTLVGDFGQSSRAGAASSWDYGGREPPDARGRRVSSRSRSTTGPRPRSWRSPTACSRPPRPGSGPVVRCGPRATRRGSSRPGPTRSSCAGGRRGAPGGP